MKACCNGWGRLALPKPSTVVTDFPTTLHTGLVQHFSGAPSISTMQQPHCSRPQPKRVPISPSSLRRTSSSGVSSLASDTLTGLLLTEKSKLLGTHAPKSRTALAESVHRDYDQDRTAC